MSKPSLRGSRSTAASAFQSGQSARPTAPAQTESLEPRVLMAFSADVNFQPAGAAVPAGYVADVGRAFGPRGNGLSYGWNGDISAHARNRDAASSPDQRYDTLNHLQKPSNPNAKWEIAVPNGAYNVTLAAGDPTAWDSVYRLNLENTLALTGTPTSGSRWVTRTVRVNVSDGRLTLSSAAGAVNNKINFIRITDAPAAGAPLVSVRASDASAAEPGTNTARFVLTRTGGDLSRQLDVSYHLGGTAANGTDYSRLSGWVTIRAGRASTTVTVTPRDDASAEGYETVTLTVKRTAAYGVGSPASATATIADNDAGGTPTNRPPNTPVFLEPSSDNEVLSGEDVHMMTAAFSDPNAGTTSAGRHASTDWQILRAGNREVVWQNLRETGEASIHTHFGDGQFVNSLAGHSKLPGQSSFIVRVRHRDAAGAVSNWAERPFRTAAELAPLPNAPDWTVDQPGYKVERLPVRFADGRGEWRLPVNIAFIPNPGPNPSDPFFYVTELYGTIRVVSRDLTVRTYAANLLNYDPSGPISGPGENGLTGIVVDPSNGDVYAAMLYDDPADNDTRTVPKITRFRSADGGRTASGATDIKVMRREFQGQSHQVSNLSFGPDGKLYVHNGDGISTPYTALQLDSYRGKILRMNKDGSAPSDNPLYNAADGINARDFIYAYGFRNPFGGAWRASDGQHYQVENGPHVDRLSKVRRGVNYGWNGRVETMRVNAIYNWEPAHAPVNIAFVQRQTFNGSGFPSGKQDHAFVTVSGPTYATGPQSRGKGIQEFVFGNSQPNGNLTQAPRYLAHYTGNGKATAVGLAAGPDGLYFSDLYENDPVNGRFNPLAAGANILRIRYVGVANFTADRMTSVAAPLAVRFTDTSDVPGARVWEWDFGDGTTSHDRNPTHTYSRAGSYDVKLTVTGSGGEVRTTKADYIRVGSSLRTAAVAFSTGPTVRSMGTADQTAASRTVASVADLTFGTDSDDET